MEDKTPALFFNHTQWDKHLISNGPIYENTPSPFRGTILIILNNSIMKIPQKIRDIKLTYHNLFLLGFHGEGKDTLNKPIYRIDLNSSYDKLEVILGNYPESNPNSGIVRVFQPGLKDQHCLTHEKKSGQSIKEVTKMDFVTEEDDENYYGIKYINFPEKWMNIAHSVTTVGRLCDIYKALTTKELDFSKLAKELK